MAVAAATAVSIHVAIVGNTVNAQTVAAMIFGNVIAVIPATSPGNKVVAVTPATTGAKTIIAMHSAATALRKIIVAIAVATALNATAAVATTAALSVRAFLDAADKNFSALKAISERKSVFIR